MNLLVTNTRNTQAYAIIRALRLHSEKIVVTMYGKNRLSARLSHAANSRLVDKRYYVPSPVEDWRAGRIQKENTEREEAYIRAVMRICEREKIDTIFPSFDPHVYVFSKNKERFERMGILIPIPDYETVITPLDKYRTIQAAQEVGFPFPKTFLVDRGQDLKKLADEMGFPLVIKPRFSAAGRGFEMVNELNELTEKVDRALQPGSFLIQEYIPGRMQHNIFLTLDSRGAVKMAFSRNNLRCFFRRHQNLATASESLGCHPLVPQAARLARYIGWWGGLAIQTKVDPRDGVPKLMEINPRLGNGLWERVAAGINEPLICVKVAKREEVEAAKDIPAETLFLCPVEDLIALGTKLLDLLIYRLRLSLHSKSHSDPLNCPMGITKLFRSYKETYFNRRKKIFNLTFTYFFKDPLVSFVWWLQIATSVFRAAKELGK